jgi:rod shape-determining protein MreC
LSALLLAGVALLLASALPGAGALEARGGDLVAPLSGAIEGATGPLAEAMRDRGRTHELSEANAALRLENARLEAELAALREQQIAAEQVAELVAAIDSAAADDYLPASISLRDPAPGSALLRIDRGERDGVRAGQAVFGPGATLVGVIAEADEGSAQVRLLSDPSSVVAVVLQSSRTQAALRGGSDTLALEFVPSDEAVQEGDLVLTSALGGRLPGGLLVGRVTRVERDARELFATIAVEPLTSYRELERVLVLTGTATTTGAAQ